MPSHPFHWFQPRTMNRILTFAPSLSVVLSDRWGALYLKTWEAFPLQPACRVMATWELSLWVLLSSSWKSCSPWVMALFMCFQVCGRKAFGWQHWQSSTYADHLGKERCYHHQKSYRILLPLSSVPLHNAMGRPCLKIAWEPKPTFSEKKKRNK